MRAFRWLFITGGILAVLIVLAIAIGGAWLNSFIHSDAFRHEVETRASRTLGGTVQIDAIDFNLFGGVELRGLVTQIDSSRINGQGAVVAKIEDVKCTYAFGDLLRQRLKLTGVILEKPEIILTREPAAAVIAPATSDTANAAASEAQSGIPEPFQFILDGVKLKNGSLSIRNATGVPVADLQGVSADADTAGYYTGKDVTGMLRIADMILASNVHLTDFSTPFVYRAGTLQAKSLAATGFNGHLTGDYELGTEGPSSLEINAKGLDVGQIGQITNPSATTKLNGSLDLQSKWRGVETGQANGEGDAQLTNGKLEGVRVLQDLAGVLRVKELNAPDLRKVQLHFQIDAGVTRFTGLQVDAGEFQMTGDGVIGADGALSADMVLVLTPASMTRLPKEAALFFVQRPDGSGTVAYHVGGTIDHPKTDLATRLFIQNMQFQNALGKALNRFFHKRGKAPAEQNPPPVPVSDPSAVPAGETAAPAAAPRVAQPSGPVVPNSATGP